MQATSQLTASSHLDVNNFVKREDATSSKGSRTVELCAGIASVLILCVYIYRCVGVCVCVWVGWTLGWC